MILDDSLLSHTVPAESNEEVQALKAELQTLKAENQEMASTITILQNKIKIFEHSKEAVFYNHVETLVQNGFNQIKKLFDKREQLHINKICLSDASQSDDESSDPASSLVPEGKILVGDTLVSKAKIEKILEKNDGLQYKIEEMLRLILTEDKLKTEKYYLPGQKSRDKNTLPEVYITGVMNIINNYNKNTTPQGSECGPHN